MPAIYISHRKEDTPGTAAHLYKNLSESFGPQAVFMNVAASQPGRDVRQVIDEHLADSAVMLVVIGKDWADAKDESGQRRLDNPQDLVRIEVAAALRCELPVIPVLVQGAVMVQPAELPPDLADLAFRNPVTLLQSQWGSDVETLVRLLKSLVQGQGADASAAAEPARDPSPAAAPPVRVVRPQPVGKLPWRRMLAAMAVVVVMALGVYAFMASRHAPAGKTVAQAQPAAAPARAEAAQADMRAAQAQSAKDQVQRDAARELARVAAEAAKAATAEKATAEKIKTEKAVAELPVAPAVASAPVRDAASRASGSETPQAVLPAAPAAKPPPAAASAAMKPALPASASAAAKVLSFQKWTLNSGGCGAGPLTVTGTASFSVEKTSDAIVVTEEFRGSGGGFDVVVTGQVEFSREQPSYDIPTSGEWTGATRAFKTTGTDRVTTSDGLTPRGASVVNFQSLCR